MKQFHIMCDRGDVGRYVLMPGDPGRCVRIASHLSDAVMVAKNREFTVYTGKLGDAKVSVCSTGIGGPSAAIAVEELAACGADTFIRIGTCGGIAEKVAAGDAIIALGAVRQEGTSAQYMPPEYPAVANLDVTLALRDAARDMGLRFHTGVVQSKDSFYGQHSPERMPVAGELLYKWEAWKRGGVLASEMEAAAIFVAAAVLRRRAGAIFAALWNQETGGVSLDEAGKAEGEAAVIGAAVGAVRQLIRMDLEAGNG